MSSTNEFTHFCMKVKLRLHGTKVEGVLKFTQKYKEIYPITKYQKGRHALGPNVYSVKIPKMWLTHLNRTDNVSLNLEFFTNRRDTSFEDRR